MSSENLFENLQLLNESEELFEMAKIMPEFANDKNCGGKLDVYIYFSTCKAGHSPRVKFFGGTKETKNSDKAPTFTFDSNGAGEIILQPWMNKKTCPNAFNKSIINNVKKFINATLPILLMVWFDRLDESYALKYFEGSFDLNTLINKVDAEDYVKTELLKANNLNELHDMCKRFCMYNF